MNTATKRRENDYYPTPEAVIENFLVNYMIDPNKKILEPCAGSGNIIKALQKHGCKNIDAVEIDEDHADELLELLGIGHVAIADFLKIKKRQYPEEQYDIIITNPPYSKAQEFVEKALELVNETGVVIMLLRTAFLESQKRFEFWQKPENKLSALYTLSSRPSFIGKGTDATSYSWFIWDKNTHTQEIKVIRGK